MSPVNPSGQLHVYPFSAPTQAPPFKHGLLPHSFISKNYNSHIQVPPNPFLLKEMCLNPSRVKNVIHQPIIYYKFVKFSFYVKLLAFNFTKLTFRSSPSIWACTSVSIFPISTTSSILAWSTGAFIQVWRNRERESFVWSVMFALSHNKLLLITQISNRSLQRVGVGWQGFSVFPFLQFNFCSVKTCCLWHNLWKYNQLLNSNELFVSIRNLKPIQPYNLPVILYMYS